MKSPEAILKDTEWIHLGHAYDAASDTPRRLLELLDSSPDVQAFALAQLDASVLHQGSLYSATAPTALFIAGILTDPRTDVSHVSAFPWDDRRRLLRASLIEWLGRVGDAASHGEGDEVEPFEDADERDAVLACRAIRPQLAEAITPFLRSADEVIGSAAAVAHSYL